MPQTLVLDLRLAAVQKLKLDEPELNPFTDPQLAQESPRPAPVVQVRLLRCSCTHLR